MGSAARAVIALVAIGVVYLLVRSLTRKLKPALGFAGKMLRVVGWVVLVLGLSLMIPTTLKLTFGSPAALGFAVVCLLGKVCINRPTTCLAST